jgi:RNA-directed DNA polymerase
MDNLVLAERKARRGKRHQYGVKLFDRNKEANLLALHRMLMDGTYRTSAYKTFIIKDPKEREVFKLPYFPDRIAHHAYMNKLEDMFVRNFTADTYSCIKGRGIYLATNKLKKALRDIPGTTHYLQMDIRKFYQNIDHGEMKKMLLRKIKDRRVIRFQEEIIDSAPGLPIGNLLSQYWANYYLSGLDHLIKEKLGVERYFRYADDMVILHHDKKYLHRIAHEIRHHLEQELKLKLKRWRIAPVHTGLNFLGYIFRHQYIKLRKRTKRNLIRTVRYNPNRQSLASYNGWLSFGNCNTLRRKYLHETV